ncbi:MAG TPA: hypothetical protein VIL42_10690 [Sphingomicrobium sp.]
MCQADQSDIIAAQAASPSKIERVTETALYDAGCELGQMIDLIDTMVDVTDEDWVDPAKTLRRIGSLLRIARDHTSRTLATVLAAEGAPA